MAALDWPGLDYPVIVTTSIDGTARVWDPLRPDRELTYLPLFGQGNSVVVPYPTTLAFASSRGFLVFELEDYARWPGQEHHAINVQLSLAAVPDGQ